MSKIDNVKEKFEKAYEKVSDFYDRNEEFIWGGIVVVETAVLTAGLAYGIGKLKGAMAIEKSIAEVAPEAYTEICTKLSAKQAAEYIAKLK